MRIPLLEYVLATVLLALPSVPCRAAPAAASLLPATTRIHVAVDNLPQFLERWNDRQPGQLLNDPRMEPFLDGFRKSLRNSPTSPLARIGLTWEDVKAMASGEVSAALVEGSQGRPGLVLMAATQGREARVREVVQRLEREYTSHGASRSAQSLGGASIELFQFPQDKGTKKSPREWAFFAYQDLFCITNDAVMARSILERWSAAPPDRLERQASFQYVRSTCRQAAGERVVDLWWYLDPFATEALVGDRGQRNVKGSWQVARNQGFHAVRAVGGAVVFTPGPYDTLHYVAMHAPGPFAKAARMLDFAPLEATEAPGWLSADVALWTTAEWNLARAFDAYGTLFEELYGESQPGLFEQVVRDLLVEPDSPGVDVRRELVAQLVGPVHMIRPSGAADQPGAGGVVYAVRTRDEATVLRAVERLLNDPDVTPQRLGPHTTFVFGDLRAHGAKEGEAPDSLYGPDFSHYAFTVANGYLFVATRADLLEKLLLADPGSPRLNADAEFLMVMSAVKQMIPHEAFFVQFARAGEAIHPTYEALRAGKPPQTNGMGDRLAGALIDMLVPRSTSRAGEAARHAIDFTRLPPFAVVRDSLSASGTVAKNVPDGWLFVTFLGSRVTP